MDSLIGIWILKYPLEKNCFCYILRYIAGASLRLFYFQNILFSGNIENPTYTDMIELY